MKYFVLLVALAIIAAILSSYFISKTMATTGVLTASKLAATSAAVSAATSSATSGKFPYPAYFFSHGGPTFMYETDPMGDAGAWKTVKKLGNHIKNELKPDYIVVVSAHWQSTASNRVDIAVPDKPNGPNKLIYDFYGFPDHMYKEKFVLNSSFSVAKLVQSQLQANGFQSDLVKRGIDHGVWVPFKVAFLDYNTLGPQTALKSESPDLLDIPLVQVSLTSNDDDFRSHFKLGKVLSHFRENPVWDESQKRELRGLVVFSGMSVHNLRDLSSFRNPDQVKPYAKKFNALLRDTLVNDDHLLERLENFKLEHRQLLYQAHPTLEHFAPLVAASGIVSGKSEPIKELYNKELASLGWGIYQFGA